MQDEEIKNVEGEEVVATDEVAAAKVEGIVEGEVATDEVAADESAETTDEAAA
jgi:hypothetical protein